MPQSPLLHPQGLQRLEDLLQRTIGQPGQLPGAQTLIWRRGQLADFRCAGLRDIERGLPVTEDTIFRIYSMTKPVVSVALLMLLEEGRFRLDSPASEFIPQFADLSVFSRMNEQTGELITMPLKSPVTVHQLLTHTSGLTYEMHAEQHPVGQAYKRTVSKREGASLKDMVEHLLTLPLAYQPGTRWHYSVSTDVVARLVEVISGKPIDQFLQERLFDPLGMKDTGYHVAPESRSRLAELYCVGNWFAPEVTPELLEAAWNAGASLAPLQGSESELYKSPHNVLRGGHGLVSTSLDYLQFCRLLLQQGEWEGDRLLGHKTIELMRANHIRPELLPLEIRNNLIPGEGFGLGVSVNLDPAFSRLLGSPGSYGWAGLASTKFLIDPQEELILIQMGQLIPPPEHLFFQYFRNVAYQALNP
jgi:CubicO group peptidase (beta-lactamase class C family)